jgi:14-3-3 protein epsilon
MSVPDLDVLWFAARTAEKLGRPLDAIDFLCTMITANPVVTAYIADMFIRLFLQALEANAKLFRLIESNIPANSYAHRMVLGGALGSLRVEQFKFCEKIEFIIRYKMVNAGNIPPLQVLFFKTLGDTYTHMEPFLDGNGREQRLAAAKDSYEAGIAIASKFNLNETCPQYLRCVLNWTVFQRTRLRRTDEAARPLFLAYSKAMKEFHQVPPEDRAEVAAVMELMRSNLASWTAADEPERPVVQSSDKAKPKKK